MDMDRATDKCGGFWSTMRSAVTLPLLLGDHEVAFRLDKMIRRYISTSTSPLSEEEVEQEY